MQDPTNTTDTELLEMSPQDVQEINYKTLAPVPKKWIATLSKVLIEGVRRFIKQLTPIGLFGQEIIGMNRVSEKPFLFSLEEQEMFGKTIKFHMLPWAGTQLAQLQIDGDKVETPWISGVDIIPNNPDDEEIIIKHFTEVEKYYLVKNKDTGSKYLQEEPVLHFNPTSSNPVTQRERRMADRDNASGRRSVFRR